MKRFALICCIAVMGLVFPAGCAHQVSSTAPATPQTPYQKAAVYIDDFSVALVQAQQVVLMLHQQKYIDDPTNRTIEAAFAQIAQKGATIDTLLAANADASTIADAISANSAALDSIVASGAAGIKDPATQQKFTLTIGALKSLLQIALTFIKPTATSEVIYERGSHSYSDRESAPDRPAGVFGPAKQAFYRDAADDRPGDRGRASQFSEGRADRGQRRVVLA